MARRRTYPRWLIRGLVIFAIGMTVFAAVVSREHHGAESARNQALSRLVALRSETLQSRDPALAMQLAAVAYGLAQTTDARSALLDATAGEMPTRLTGRPGRTLLALGDDGHRVALTHQFDDRVAIYRLHYSQLTPLATVRGFPSAQIEAVALSDNGRLLATGDDSGRVTLWRLAPSQPPTKLTVVTGYGHGAVSGLSFSPAGGSLAAADTSGRVTRWSLADPSQPALAAPLTAPGVDSFDAVSYSHDGSTLAGAGSHGSLVIWAAHAGRRPLDTVTIGSATLSAVVYSPDGRMIAVGNDGGVDLRTLNRRGIPAPTGSYLTTDGTVTSLAFSRDSRYVAAGTTTKAATIWSTSALAEVADLPHPAAVTGVAFADADRRLLSTNATGTTTIWQFPAPSTYTFGSALTSVAFAATAPRVVVRTRAGRSDQWDVVSEWRPAPVGSWYAAPLSAAPPKAYWLKAAASATSTSTTTTTTTTTTTSTGASTTTAGTVTTGTTTTGAPTLINPHAGDQALRRVRAVTRVGSSTLSPDGLLFAAGGSDHLVWLWDVSQPARPRLLAKLSGFTARVTSVLFTGNSQTLFAASADHTVRIWGLSKPSQPQQLSSSPLTGPRTTITRLALSPDNRTLAAATFGGSVWLWGVTRPAKASLSATLTAARGPLTALAFSPSDNTLVAGGANRRLLFWHYRAYQAVNRICALEGTPITPGEWGLLVPGAPYKPPCADWKPPAPAVR